MSVSVTHSIQGLTLRMFRDDLLHGTVVACDYFTYRCVSVSLNSLPILLWPLSLTTRFRPQNCSIACFCVFHTITLETVVCENPRRSAVSQTLKPLLLAPTVVILWPPFGCLVWINLNPYVWNMAINQGWKTIKNNRKLCLYHILSFKMSGWSLKVT